MFVALLIGGRDYGQLRPGLAEGQLEAEVASNPVMPVAEPEAQVIEAAFTPDVPMETLDQPANELAAGAVPVVDAELVDVALAEATEAPDAESAKVWYVTATSVNVREQPGTNFAVLDKLAQGEAVTVVSTDDTGWAHIRIEGDGIEGFVSTDFLSQSAP